MAIWFKGNSLNHSLYYWMAYLKRLKTSYTHFEKGISSIIKCHFCDKSLESHQHFFFECTFIWSLLKELVPIGHFFLLEQALTQVLYFAFSLDHKSLTQAYLLITSILIYQLWREMNSQNFARIKASILTISYKVKEVMAYKFRRWNIKGIN